MTISACPSWPGPPYLRPPGPLYGLAGDDHIEGSPGGDWLDGGPGGDRLEGRRGDDVLIGGPGDALKAAAAATPSPAGRDVMA